MGRKQEEKSKGREVTGLDEMIPRGAFPIPAFQEMRDGKDGGGKVGKEKDWE